MSVSFSGHSVRQYILDRGVRIWMVAENFGCSESTFSRKLRHSFSQADFDRIVEIVAVLEKAE